MKSLSNQAYAVCGWATQSLLAALVGESPSAVQQWTWTSKASPLTGCSGSVLHHAGWFTPGGKEPGNQGCKSSPSHHPQSNATQYLMKRQYCAVDECFTKVSVWCWCHNHRRGRQRRLVVLKGKHTHAHMTVETCVHTHALSPWN